MSVRPTLVATTVALIVLGPVSVPSQAEGPVDIGSRLELFVDDYLVDSVSGTVSFDLKRPVPQEVSLVTDAPWEGNVCAYYTVFQDGPLYRMYYRGLHIENGVGTHAQVTCYAQSTDGVSWTKPNLGLIEYDGSTQNNIVWKDPGSHNFTPFKDTNPNAAPDAQYKALAWNGGCDVSDLAGTPARILFELNDADLYSFQFSIVPEPSTALLAVLGMLLMSLRRSRKV